jgi:NAD(P)H-dependent flavin oxidoreductase YrpB (nitropropane dioxygenase family)
VANAGALGFITGLTQPTPEDLRKEIARTREMTDKPFSVNLTILPTLRPVPYQEYADAIAESGVNIVETASRSPEPFMPTFKGAGIRVIHKCTSVRHSVKTEAVGCDAVSVDGFEYAGHPGEDNIPGLILLPCTADKISVPFVASGGFGDARGLVAALALGADGINMGSHFMCTKEAPIHDKVKQAMVEADELNTQLMNRTLRNTSRVFKNEVASKIVEIHREKGAHLKIGDLAEYLSGQRGKVVFEDGDVDHGVWSAGMVVGLIHDVPSCAELVSRIVHEAEDIIAHRLPRLAGFAA